MLNPKGRLRLIRCQVIVSLALLVCGCSDTAPAGPSELRAGASVHDRAAMQPSTRSFDDEMLALADSVPAFAGFVVNDKGELATLIAGELKALSGSARETLARYVESKGWAREFTYRSSQVRQVKFSAAILLRARRAFESHLSLLGLKEYSVDFDEQRNQVSVGVRSSTDSVLAQNDLLRLGLPLAAIHVEVGRLPIPAAELRDNVPPLRGGMGIRSGSVVGPVCTIGPPIKMYDGISIVNVALTNSHCTTTVNGLGVNGGDSVRQAGQPIGREVRDFSGSTLDCPIGKQCRYADLAVVSITQGLWALNTIANVGYPHSLTTSRANQESYPYPREIVDQDTVVGFDANTMLPAGTYLRKTGQTTGTTGGSINGTCLTVYNSAVAKTLLCQNRVLAHFGQGDSGSPVYSWVANPPWLGGNAVIRGIAWGGIPNAQDVFTQYVYSTAWSIAQEAPVFDQ